MTTPGEDTPLLAGTSKNGLTDESAPRIYKKQSRLFHISAIVGLIVVILLAAAATVWFFYFKTDGTSPDLPDIFKKFLFKNDTTARPDRIDTSENIPSHNDPSTILPDLSEIRDSDSISSSNDQAPEPDGPSAQYASEEDKSKLLNNSYPLPDEVPPVAPELTALTSSFLTLMSDAVDEGKQKLEEKQAIDVQPLNESDASFRHQRAIADSSSGNEVSNLGYIENVASKYLHDKGVVGVVSYNLTKNLKWTNESGCAQLNESVSCNTSLYRSIDGFCNNVMNPAWGAAMKPFRRALLANYSDGVTAPRGDYNTSLPSARDVSTQIHRPVYREDRKFTVMLAVWGQFIDHDISATALSRGPNGETIACCRSGKTDPECFPVQLNPEDEYYSKYNITCMEFVRSAAALRCSFGPREQLNQVSSFLDGSMIYGSTEKLSMELRTLKNGELEMSYSLDGRALLPVTTNITDGCNQEEQIKKGRYCFLSGDSRANENTHLTSMHLILARQHNEVAKKLQELNPDWDDEKLYQEARRIVAAQVQHITYKEFLPNILGDEIMEKLKLYPKNESYWTSYNASVDPRISNNFATSSFRFAHTLIPRMMKVLANDTSSPEYVEMHKMLFNPFGLHEGDLDSIMRGAMDTPVEKADNYFTEQVTEHLFESTTSLDNETEANENSTKPHYGLDLVALNIQRGRDHGLPGYVKWREYCNLSSVKSFDDLKDVFDPESSETVSKLYNSVDDIDLYTGSLSEKPISGGLVGPTLTCLIADQFYRLKYGDRYWFETNEQPQAFTPEQLDEIRKTSLAGIICQNSDNLTYITPEVMRSAGEDNERIPCSEIPQPDLSHWKESNAENETQIIRAWQQMLHGGHIQGARFLFENAENGTGLVNLTHNWHGKSHKNPHSWASYAPENITAFNETDLPEWIIQWTANSTLLPEDAINVGNNYTPLPPSYVILPNQTAEEGYSDELCNFTIQARDIEVFRKTKGKAKPPVEILISAHHSKTLMWNLNDTDSLFEAFTTQNESGIFAFKAGEWYNATCAVLRPECHYYSKVVYGDLANSTRVFEISATHAADECSIIAPVVLQGHYLSTDTFLWNGNITIYTRTPKTSLSKEEELSLHKHTQRKSVSLPKVTGTVTLRETAIWNGTLPVVFNPSELSWYSTEDTIVYAITWSGFYDVSVFKGVFLVPHKSNGSIRWHDGSFSIDLPEQIPSSFTELIQTNRVYSSVVYLTNNPSGIDRFDVSVFNLIEDWVFVDYSQIVLTGEFDKHGAFLWSGDISVLMPSRLSVDLPSTTYRPYGKYLFTVNEVDLFAQLHSEGSVLKWWSGVLPPIVLIPSGVYDERLYANILGKTLVWSFDNDTASTGAGQFRVYDKESEMVLFGDFGFDFAFLMEDIWTSKLEPNTTYYSPILMQYERMTFDFGDDMPERLKLLDKPELGMLAPITMLGEFHENRTIFKWNHKCLVTVIDV